jgi:iron(III) transport system ATP-binding protein
MSGLSLKRVSHAYDGHRVVDDVSLEVRPGELVCLLGPSGCGKTTLLRLAAGLEVLQHGQLNVGGRTVGNAVDGRHVPPEDRGIGLMFQDYALFPHLTIFENIAFGLFNSPPERRQWVTSALAQMDMADFADSYPHTLSGGQQQRAALLRALAPEPRVLLLDEPFSGLDVTRRAQVREETLGLLKQTGVATLMVTHDPEEAMFMADRILVMVEGRIVQAGTPVETYFQPVDSFVAALFGPINQFGGIVEGGRIQTPIGPFTASSLADGTRADILVRPEGLRLALPGETTTRGYAVPPMFAIPPGDAGPHTNPPASTRTPSLQPSPASCSAAPVGPCTTPVRILSAHLLGRSSHVHLGADGPDGGEIILHAQVPGVFLPTAGTEVTVTVDPRQAFVFPVS